MLRTPLLLGLLFCLFLSAALQTPASSSCPFCYPEGPLLPGSGPNINWVLKDSLSACPAGDSLILYGHSATHPHPSRLRIEVWYNDNNCNPRPKVPPDSIWVTWSTLSGNVIVNDKGTKIFADDSTDALCGHTWVTIPSFSGCGTLRVNLYVAGVAQGNKTVVIRTTDSNADGRVNGADLFFGVCDMNYDGTADDNIAAHSEHWRRNALHGTPVRRTDLTSTGRGKFGSGGMSWEPSGDSIMFSSFRGPNGECIVEFVPSDPKNGNTLVPRTFPPANDHDYDPSWSARGFEFTFDREDSVIYRKGIPGIAPNPDTVEVTVAATPNPTTKFITEGAMSPNGRAVAFTQIDFSGVFQWANLYTVPITGGAPVPITSGTTFSDRMPQWSPDGRWIYFGRKNQATGRFSLYKVRDTGDSLTLVWDAIGRNASLPGTSTDGLLVAAHIDSAEGRPAFVHTVEANFSGTGFPPAIANYLNFPNARKLVPRISPDGTRLAFVAPPPGGAEDSLQVWAVRRNMNNPPTLAAIGDKVVTQGDSLFFYVSATDPESDALTYVAYFLRTDLGMSFNPTTRLFSWRPPAGQAGNSYWIRFQVTTTSGGADWEVIKISVIQPGAPARAASGVEGVGVANPSRGPFALATTVAPALKARLSVFSLSGRLVAKIEIPARGRIAWDAKTSDGEPAAPGIYFYRLEVGQVRRTGKWVLVR